MSTVVHLNRAEPPPNPNGGYVERLIAKGSGKGSETRWERPDSHPLSQARRAGRINDLQFHAGDEYRDKWQIRAGGTTDSTTRIGAVRAAWSGPFSEAQCDARNWLTAVEWILGPTDRRIIRAVCGEGRQPSEAVRAVEPNFKRTVSEVFRHSLDALAEAIDKARKINFRLPVGE